MAVITKLLYANGIF